MRPLAHLKLDADEFDNAAGKCLRQRVEARCEAFDDRWEIDNEEVSN